MKQLIGLIGYPVQHSLSPFFQQAACNYHNLDIEYQVWETKPDGLRKIISQLNSPHIIGANVTTPYKEKVLELLDEVDDLGFEVGAINTIIKKGDKLVGLNTDVYGFYQSLKVDADFIAEGKKAVILGAGGAARAVTYSLIKQNISSIVISNRASDKALALIDYFNNYCHKYKNNVTLYGLPWQSRELSTVLIQCDLVINCTTIGMKYTEDMNKSPLTMEMINPNALIYDLVYNPSETELLKTASKYGARTLNGLLMLIYQGAAAFELWTKMKAPFEVMLNAANAELNKT